MVRDVLLNEIVQKLDGTEEAEIITFIDERYESLLEKQNKWSSESGFCCVEGCGSCCHNFEPDLLESELLYMAAWMICHKKEMADELAMNGARRFFDCDEAKGITDKTCIFFDKDNKYHCSIYEGRGFLCRLFGLCSARDKNNQLCWKPCKFYPAEKLKEYKIPLTHRQYSATEAESIFGSLPPAMSDIMEEVVNRFPSRTETASISEALPKAIGRLYWLISLKNS